MRSWIPAEEKIKDAEAQAASEVVVSAVPVTTPVFPVNEAPFVVVDNVITSSEDAKKAKRTGIIFFCSKVETIFQEFLRVFAITLAEVDVQRSWTT